MYCHEVNWSQNFCVPKTRPYSKVSTAASIGQNANIYNRKTNFPIRIT